MSEKRSDPSTINQLENFKVPVKIKLAALWCSVMFCYVYGDYFSLYVPNKVQDFINGRTLLDSPLKLFAASILMVIPALMIFLSVAMKPQLNRWLNILFGSIYTVIMLLIAISSIAPWWSFYVFLAMVEMAFTTTIVVYAWRWPKRLE
jgi:MFS-type transporter involved in bile tolerance (Atg22 family)